MDYGKYLLGAILVFLAIVIGVIIVFVKVLSVLRKESEAAQKASAQRQVQLDTKVEQLRKKIESEQNQLSLLEKSLKDASKIKECQEKIAVLSYAHKYVDHPVVVRVADDVAQNFRYLIKTYIRGTTTKQIKIEKRYAASAGIGGISWVDSFNHSRSINFAEKNLKNFENKLQVTGFITAIAMRAELVFQQTYVAMVSKDISGTPYTYNIKVSPDSMGASIDFTYEAPNGYYQAPKEWL